MVIGKMPCLQMCSCYPSLCVLKKSFSSSWFVVLCKYNKCTSFEIKFKYLHKNSIGLIKEDQLSLQIPISILVEDTPTPFICFL